MQVARLLYALSIICLKISGVSLSQLITDINYSEITDFSEMEFVVPGPGARDGLKKCFSNNAGLNDAELIRLMADNQEAEFERLDIKFQSLWGRKLHRSC